MPVRYDIKHTTVYRYRQPVRFGEHRVMFRPRDSHDLRVLATDLDVSPESSVRMIQDPLSNSVALVQPLERADTLEIVCSFRIEHAHTNNLELPLSPSAEVYPFAYTLDERYDLEHYLRPYHDDPDGELTAWARQFIRTDGPTGTRELLIAMNQHIRDNLRYLGRDEEGTQSPVETLKAGSGSCRDFALLMMEAARRLGFATPSRASGDPALDGRAPERHRRRLHHAWLQAYLPGAGGCRSIRPTTCRRHAQLIRVGLPGDRRGAPISGSWFGESDDYLGMTVSVAVTRR
jgi:transglutaminase-like putative cysteine protease